MNKIHRRPTVVATAVLLTGVAASMAGNVQAIHLDKEPPGVGAHLSAFFWPLILLFVVELLIHTPWLSNWRDRLTKGFVVLLVAATAAWVSYWHMAHVLSEYGYDVASRYAGPLAADAAMVLAALALNRIGQARQAAMAEPALSMSMDYSRPIGPMSAPVQAVQVATATQEDAETSAAIMSNPMAYMSKPTVADEAQSYLDRLSTELDSGTTAAYPVSPAPMSNVVKLDSVPDTARDMIQVWLDAPVDSRPTPGQADALVAAAHEVTARTARRWRDALKASA